MSGNNGKTLGDYFLFGRHEFVAFVRPSRSVLESEALDTGNKLGEILFGVLVCDKDKPRAEFFYKLAPVYERDSDISFYDLEYSSHVVSELPLAVDAFTFQGAHLKTGTQEFEEAKELLSRHGLY